GLSRQRHCFETCASVKQDHRRKRRRLKKRRFPLCGSEDVCNGGLSKSHVSRELTHQLGKTAFEPGPIMYRKPIRSRLPGFYHFHHAIAVPIAVKQPITRRLVQFINSVVPPVATSQVHSAVPVEVAGDNTRPPAGQVGEPPLSSHFFEV